MIPRNANAIAIDPGYSKKGKGCACARAERGQLTRAWYERGRDFVAYPGNDPEPVDYVIVEQPQQDGRSWAVPPAILIKLAWEGMKLAALYAGACSAELLDPTVDDWKGTEKKPAMHKRMWKILTPAEREVLGGESTEAQIEKACERGALCRWSKSSDELYGSWAGHNLLDAAALLMCALGRLKKVG